MKTIPGYRFEHALNADDDFVLFRGVRESDSEGAIIKVLRRDAIEARDAALLRNEFDLARCVEAVGVLRAVEVRRAGGGVALVFEDFESELLRSRLERGRVDLQTALAIAANAADALAAIHGAGVVHKRVAPASLLVAPGSAEIRLTDFSVASRLRRERGTASAAVHANWLPYVSPEQTGRMNRLIDYRTDLYSLGVTLYEMLTGGVPFAADDVMGLVHCHIARRARPPSEVSTDVPETVSKIVMRLLAKRAEDRYQSALGLKADLEACLRSISVRGDVVPFALGTQDVSHRLEIPEKLYGREEEVARLITAFDRAAEGAAEIYIVAGYSGVGKSALVREVHRPIVARRGYFISGKFDQFQRDIPYSALIEAFSDMVGQILSESADDIAEWRNRFHAALGDNAAVIVEMIPEFELIVGTCARLPALSPTEEQIRFNLAFQRFVQACASSDQPLAVFLDDLQWADLATLQLVQRVGSDPDMRHILEIGAYRDNEVELHHPLMLTIAELHKSEAHVEEVVLQPLAPDHLRQLVADSLHAGPADVAALTELVHTKTGGNPFYVRQFLEALHENRLLEFDPEAGGWNWDLDRIRAADVTSNVVDLMVRKIRSLPDGTQDALRLAACVGNHFELDALCRVRQSTRERTAGDLWEAIREGLVLPIGQAYRLVQTQDPTDADEIAERDTASRVPYRFLHDRVQQAAYAMIPSDERVELHMRIGRQLAAGLTAEERVERVFDIVNHLNFGAGRMSDVTERLELARLNLAAGAKAMTSSAYDPAAGYFAVGLSLLPTDAWESDYELAHALHDRACAAEAMRLEFARMDELAEIVLRKSLDALDTVGVYMLRIQHLSTLGRMRDACYASIDILERLGVSIPKKPSKLTVLRTFFGTKLRLSRTSPAELLEAPVMTDARALAAIEVCARTGPPAYQGAPDLLPLLICKEIELSLQYGNARPSSHGFGAWAVLLSAVMNDCEGAYAYGKLGEDVARRFDDKGTLGRAIFMFNCFSRHWMDSQRSCDAPTVEARALLVDAGDLEYFGYATYHPTYFALFAGERLQLVHDRFEQGIINLERLDQAQAIPMARIGRQATLNLLGETPTPTSLASDDYDPDALVPEYVEKNHRAAVHYTHLLTAMLSYIFRDVDRAVERAHEAERFVDGVAAMMVVVELNLYQSLALVAQARAGASGSAVIRRDLKKVRRNQKVMARWAKAHPGNFAHKHALVEAELSSLHGRHRVAVEAYDRAIAGARASGFVHEEAIACECAALHYIAAGRKVVAAAYLQDASDAYAQWGATAKLRALRDTYPELLRSPELFETAHTPDPSGLSGGTGSEDLDLASVMKASRAISGEIVLERLQATLLELVVENAGAERGLLVRIVDGEAFIEAEASAEGLSSTMRTRVVESGRLSAAIVNYAIRTKSPVVIEDAARETQFASDPYVSEMNPRSVLAVPIVHQGGVTGVVYVENNLTSGAFTTDRVEVLRLLASQASISLENARLYTDLASLNRAYERFVPRAFLRFLAKRSILDVELGDHIERDLFVLFADIRSFTALSESMSPQENFRFLNAYLGRMEPIVIRHGGFIDKYMGDAIMALFEGTADATVQAAIEMVRALDDHNTVRVARGDVAIRVGIGINSGPAMLGTIGGHDRMDGTVIGDTVNVAARVEGLTKRYGASILVSQDTVDLLADAERYRMRELGRVRVQGKTTWTTIHEIYGCDPPDVVELKDATKADVEAGLRLYHAGDLAGAIRHFTAVLDVHPADRGARFLLQRAEEAAEQPPPADWDGAITFLTK